MNDGLSDDIKRRSLCCHCLTTESQDHKEKVFQNVPVSPTLSCQWCVPKIIIPKIIPKIIMIRTGDLLQDKHLDHRFYVVSLVLAACGALGCRKVFCQKLHLLCGKVSGEWV